MLPVIKFSVERNPKVLKAREWNKMLKTVWYHVGRFWHRYILPKHFTQKGANEYKYAKRQGQGWEADRGWSRTYHARKIKIKHHGNPLEYTGSLKRAAMGLVDVRATGNGANIYLRGLPPHVNFMPHAASPNMKAELTAISLKDTETLIRVGDKEINKQLKKLASGTSTLSLR